MIPFKQKTNSILKNTAVLLILVCISDSCFSYLQDSTRTTEESRRFINDYQRQVAHKDQNGRLNTVLQRELVEVSPYVRDVRADSRQSRIDSRDIRTDFREIRTELRNIDNTRRDRHDVRYERQGRLIRDQRIPITAAGNQDHSRQRETGSRDLNNNIRHQDTRKIREHTRDYQNYSRQNFQRQLSDRRSQESSMERRDLNSARHNTQLLREGSQENRNRGQNDNESRQIRARSFERMSVDRRIVQEDSRDDRNIRERSQENRDRRQTNNEHRQIRDRRLERLSEDRRVVREDSRKNTSQIPREESRRNVHVRSEADRIVNDMRMSPVRREVREHARRFRDVQERSNNQRTTSRNNHQHFNLQARRDVRECSMRQRVREIALDRRSNNRECYKDEISLQKRNIQQNLNRQQRDIRENVQERQNLRERSDANENRQSFSEIQRSQNIRKVIRQDNRREEPDRSYFLQERRNYIEMSRHPRISSHRLEDSRQDERRHIENTREWSRTLRETRRLIKRQDERRERQPVLLETTKKSLEHSRRIQEDRQEFTRDGNSPVADRRTEESRTRQIMERREDSRTNLRQQADRRETSENVEDRREVVKESDGSEQRERFIDQRREVDRDTREVDRRNIRGTNSRRDLKDSRAFKVGALQDAEFIPHFKEKSDILSSTLQALLIVALFGQLYFNTSKHRLGLPTFFGKEKVF